MDGNFMVYEPDGKFISKGEIQAAPPESARRAMAEKYGEAYRQWWSAEIRLKDMDRLGWDIQILLPTGNNGNFAYRVALKDLQLGAAMCRAYNNWCHDYCSTDPKRLKFVAVLPGSDVVEMVKEARRAVEQLGAVAVRNPYLPEGKWLHEPEYQALWNLRLRIGFSHRLHGETRQRRFQPFRKLEGTRRDDMELALRGLNHALGFPCDNMATLGHFIFTGVLERFPQLRLAILESNCGWLPFWLGRMDDHTHGRNSVMGKSEKLRHAAERILHAPMHRLLRQRRARAQTCGRRARRRQPRVEHRLSPCRCHRTRTGPAGVRRASDFQRSQAKNPLGQRHQTLRPAGRRLRCD